MAIGLRANHRVARGHSHANKRREAPKPASSDAASFHSLSARHVGKFGPAEIHTAFAALKLCRGFQGGTPAHPSQLTPPRAAGSAVSQSGTQEGSEDPVASIESSPVPEGTADGASMADLEHMQTPASIWLPFEDATGTARKSKKGNGRGYFRKFLRLLENLSRLPSFASKVFAFRLQQVMLGNTVTKVLGVFLLGLPMILAGGLLYAAVSGRSLLQGLISAYGGLYKIPGVMVLGEVNWATTFLMNFIWLLGTFTFAVVLGTITEDIVNYVNEVRKGNTDVVAENHTLILGWNQQTLPLMRQIALWQDSQDSAAYSHGPVVILADKSKEEMDVEVRASMCAYNLEWHTRSGRPHSLADLRRAAAGQARTVILLDPGGDDDEAGMRQVAAVLGVKAARADTQPRPFLKLESQMIAVQVPDQGSSSVRVNRQLVTAAQEVMEASGQHLDLTMLHSRSDMSMLLALSALQPGVASIYCSVVQKSRSGVQFYIKDFPSLTGHQYSAIRRAFHEAIVCGYARRENGTPRIWVNPPDSDVLQEGDRIIVLAHAGGFEPKALGPLVSLNGAGSSGGKGDVDNNVGQAKKKGPESPRRGRAPRGRAKKIVIAWWGGRFGELQKSLSQFAPRGSSVTIIAPSKPEGFPDDPSLLPNCRFQFIKGEASDADVLRSSKAASADAVIVAGLDAVPSHEADSLTIAFLTQLNHAVLEAGRQGKGPLHVVGAIKRPETIEVANYLIHRLSKGLMTAELLQPDELMSGVLCQVAADPAMGPLLSSFIYTDAGHEIYLREASRYSLLPIDMAAQGLHPVSFAQVAESARKEGETAIGYITQSGAMRMAPGHTEARHYGEGDRIIVLAED